MSRQESIPAGPDRSDGFYETAEHHQWGDEVGSSRIEDSIDLTARISGLLRVYEDPADLPENGADCVYALGSESSQLLAPAYKDETRHAAGATIGMYLHDTDESRLIKPRFELIKGIAVSYLRQHPEVTADAWWLHEQELDESGFAQPVLTEANPPVEQLIIGQQDRAVRFFNYDQPMSAARAQDCLMFVDKLSQFIGDRAYDFVTDVVIVPFAKRESVDGTVRERTRAFTSGSLPRVMFVDSDLLDPSTDEPVSDRIADGTSEFLYTLTHEGGHLIDNVSPDENNPEWRQVLHFAAQTGWDVEGIDRAGLQPEDTDHYGRFSSFRPPDAGDGVTVQHADGSFEPMPIELYEDEYGDGGAAGDGQIAAPYTMHGSPSVYGTRTPLETSAETTAFNLNSDFVARRMPVTRDAWLGHIQHRVLKPGESAADRPIATRLDRPPIVIERRTGAAILYPGVRLPARINVLVTRSPGTPGRSASG